MRYEDFLLDSRRWDHPEKQGYYPVILLQPNDTPAWPYLGSFSHWATSDGSGIIRPRLRLTDGSAQLSYGGYPQPGNYGAFSIDPKQIEKMEKLEFPLPSPYAVTKDGESDLAPLLVAHLAHEMISAILLSGQQPDFEAAPYDSCDYSMNHWCVNHKVRHGLDRPEITLIAALWQHECSSRDIAELNTQCYRLCHKGEILRMQALLGRCHTSLEKEGYYQL